MQSAAAPGALTRRQEALELAVFLLLVVPSLVLSFVEPGTSTSVSFAVVAIATIVRDLGLLFLVLLLLSRARQPVEAIGWVRRNVGKEVVIGLALSIPVLIGAQLLEAALRSLGLSEPTSSSAVQPVGAGDLLLAGILVVVVAVAEETIFRGYLILRFASVLRSRAWAVLLSSVIFAVGHGYQGSAAVVTIGLTGLVFAIVYIWRQSLVAPVVIHFVFDFIAIVLAPLASR